MKVIVKSKRQFMYGSNFYESDVKYDRNKKIYHSIVTGTSSWPKSQAKHHLAIGAPSRLSLIFFEVKRQNIGDTQVHSRLAFSLCSTYFRKFGKFGRENSLSRL